MFNSTVNQSKEVLGVNNPTVEDEQMARDEIERRKTISAEEKAEIGNFIHGLVARGQIADLGENILHRHTHLVIGLDSDGITPIIKRIKF